MGVSCRMWFAEAMCRKTVGDCGRAKVPSKGDWNVPLQEAVVKQQIAATIPDSLFMKIQNKGTALEIWEALQGDFQNKSRMVAVDLRRRLQQERCAEKGDVRMHFLKLCLMREDLASMGHAPGDDKLYAIILGSLPYSFKPFISALNATLSVLGTILSPDDLMQAFTDEYDRRNLGKSSKQDENAENMAFSTNKGNGWKGNGQKGNCYNCGKPGHRKDDCWEEGSGKEDQKPNWLKVLRLTPTNTELLGQAYQSSFGMSRD